MKRHFGSFILSLGIVGIASAVDPFSGEIPEMNSFEERELTGCNTTLLEAYKETKAAESDHTTNEPTSRLWLFTKKNRNNPESLHNCGGHLPSNSYYNKKYETIIIVPGYRLGVFDHAILRETKDQLLDKRNYNVILVDCTWANQLDYQSTLIAVPVVAKQIAFVIKNIMNQNGSKLCNFILIGQCTGAHIAGFVGKLLNNGSKKIHRIIALDPAGPAFNVNDPAKRLDKSDAKWLDVLHTNGGDCLPYFGLSRSIGHADFFPNGGVIQLSCLTMLYASLLKGDLVYATLSLFPSFCYALQSWQYFKASIKGSGEQFVAVECDSYDDFKSGKCNSCGDDGSKCSVYGLDWDRLPGRKRCGEHKFYFDTTLTCPYVDNSGIDLQGFGKTLQAIKENKSC